MSIIQVRKEADKNRKKLILEYFFKKTALLWLSINFSALCSDYTAKSSLEIAWQLNVIGFCQILPFLQTYLVLLKITNNKKRSNTIWLKLSFYRIKSLKCATCIMHKLVWLEFSLIRNFGNNKSEANRTFQGYFWGVTAHKIFQSARVHAMNYP